MFKGAIGFIIGVVFSRIISEEWDELQAASS